MPHRFEEQPKANYLHCPYHQKPINAMDICLRK
jgi:WD40 repeat protein